MILLVGGGIFWLNSAAQAAVSVSATLTVYQPAASLERSGSGAFSPAASGAQVAGRRLGKHRRERPGLDPAPGRDADASGKRHPDHARRSPLQQERHACMTTKLTEKIGRTLTSVQHLVSGATFQVAGQAAVASVRGTKFEVYIKADGTMIVKLFDGALDFDGKNHVHLSAGQQATADPQGNIGPAGPIQPDPADPFGPALAASAAADVGTTPGTEQDYIGAPIHNGEQQQYLYSYAGGSLVKASLGYPGSAMR